MSTIETHPVQRGHYLDRQQARCSKIITMRAYEVYRECFGEQEAMVTGDCRGGFGIGELIAFLYTRSFPKDEWRMRFDEAINGIENI